MIRLHEVESFAAPFTCTVHREVGNVVAKNNSSSVGPRRISLDDPYGDGMIPSREGVRRERWRMLCM